MLPLGCCMRQNGEGGRKDDRIQNDEEVRHNRRDIDAGMQHFLAERTIGGIVGILRRRPSRRRDMQDMRERR